MNKFRRVIQNNLTIFQEVVWKKYAHIGHLLSSKEANSFKEIIDMARGDVTNYSAGPFDLEIFDDRSPIPSQEEISMAIVRLLEAGFIIVEGA